DAAQVRTVAPTAGPRRVQVQSEIVPADKPVKRMPGLFVPPGIGRGPISLQAGRHHCLCFDRLLIEVGSRTAALEESVAADGAEVPVFGGLKLHQPSQRLNSSLERRFLAGSAAAQNQGVR